MMSEGSIPHPQGEDLQSSSSQILLEQAKAVQAVAEAMLRGGQSLSKQQELPKVRLEIDKGTTHQALYQKYSQRVNNQRPVQRNLSIAQDALRDHQSPSSIVQILSNDPYFQQIQRKYGPRKAQRFAQQMTRSAAQREVIAKAPAQSQQSSLNLKIRSPQVGLDR